MQITDKKMYDSTMLRFALVGVVNATVGIGTMFLLYNLANCSYWVSSAANYIVGGIISFFLNKFFTFRNKHRSWKQVARFILTVIVCYIISYGVAKNVMLWLLDGCSITIQENIAMACGTCLYTLLNYLLQKIYVFSK